MNALAIVAIALMEILITFAVVLPFGGAANRTPDGCQNKVKSLPPRYARKVYPPDTVVPLALRPIYHAAV